VFENRVLRRIFGPKRDEVTGEWRKLHNEELHDLYSLPSIISENNKSIAFVRNLSRIYCTQYNTTLHVSAIQPSSGVSYIQILAYNFYVYRT
jgi:hypothetical protein